MLDTDVVGLEEIQDDTGPTDDGVVSHKVTLERLVTAIKEASGVEYSYLVIDGIDKMDGGQPCVQSALAR